MEVSPEMTQPPFSSWNLRCDWSTWSIRYPFVLVRYCRVNQNCRAKKGSKWKASISTVWSSTTARETANECSKSVSFRKKNAIGKTRPLEMVKKYSVANCTVYIIKSSDKLHGKFISDSRPIDLTRPIDCLRFIVFLGITFVKWEGNKGIERTVPTLNN